MKMRKDLPMYIDVWRSHRAPGKMQHQDFKKIPSKIKRANKNKIVKTIHPQIIVHAM